APVPRSRRPPPVPPAFVFQAEDGIRDPLVTGVQTCALPILQTISPSYYEAASLDGASPWQQFRHVTLPLLTPIIAVVMTFSVLRSEERRVGKERWARESGGWGNVRQRARRSSH